MMDNIFDPVKIELEQTIFNVIRCNKITIGLSSST